MSRFVTAGCVLALSLVLPAFADDKAGANPAAQKMVRDIPRHNEFLQRIEKSGGAGDVIFLGDSITHGWEGQKAWQQYFGPFKPVNLGIGGDQTGHVLWRITDGHEIDRLKPKAAVIMIGTNNTGGHTAEQIAGGIKAIIEELKKQKPGIKILLLGVFPRGNFNDAERTKEQIAAAVQPLNEELKKEQPDVARLNTLVRNLAQSRGTVPAAKLNKKIGEINALIAKFDDGQTVFFKDIGQQFLDKTGGLSGDIMPDYLHLSPRGYDLWGKAIQGDLEKLGKGGGGGAFPAPPPRPCHATRAQVIVPRSSTYRWSLSSYTSLPFSRRPPLPPRTSMPPLPSRARCRLIHPGGSPAVATAAMAGDPVSRRYTGVVPYWRCPGWPTLPTI